MPIETTIDNTEKIKATLNPGTSSTPPKPAKVQPGSTKWEVVSGNATVEPIDDLNAYLKSTDEVDGIPTVFKVTADADVGEGVEEISDLLTLNVANAKATNLGVAFGQPEPK